MRAEAAAGRLDSRVVRAWEPWLPLEEWVLYGRPEPTARVLEVARKLADRGLLLWLLDRKAGWGVLAEVAVPKPDQRRLAAYRRQLEQFRRTLDWLYLPHVPPQAPEVLAHAYRAGGWHALQLELVLLEEEARLTWSQGKVWDAAGSLVDAEEWRKTFTAPAVLLTVFKFALLEALAFEQLGWDVAECLHGRHYFVRDNRRRKDCPRHASAGQKARWRKGQKQGKVRPLRGKETPKGRR
jgi:hypothetical protein